MSYSYPFSKIPKNLQDIIDWNPLEEDRPKMPLPPKKLDLIEQPALPKKPVEPRFEKEEIGCAGALLIPVLGLLFLGAGKRGNELLIFFCCLFLLGILVFAIKIVQRNSRNEAKYYNDKGKYPQLLKEWNEECKRLNEEYQKQLKSRELNFIEEKWNYENTTITEHAIKLNEFSNYEASEKGNEVFQNRKYKQLALIQSATMLAEDYTHDTKPTRGVSEQFFFDYINNRKKIVNSKMIKFYTNKTVKDSKYLPDITAAIKLSTYWLYIDIEIDEPYIGKDGTPIHYIEGTDEQRDLYFIKHGWVVLRFAEEQVVKYPAECFKYIHRLIAKCIVYDRTYWLDKPKEYPNLPSIKRWSKDEAHSMAFRRYRNTYLKSAFIEYLPSEEQENEQEFD